MILISYSELFKFRLISRPYIIGLYLYICLDIHTILNTSTIHSDFNFHNTAELIKLNFRLTET